MKLTSTLIRGHVLDALKLIPDKSIHVCITSPPYYALRAYDIDPDDKHLEIGQEVSLGDWLDGMVTLGRELRRVLRDDGSLWMNFGDSYNSEMTRGAFGDQSDHGYETHGVKRRTEGGYSKKCRLAQPQRALINLIEDGWIFRDELIWHKTNPMPSSIKDRSTPAHEPIYMFSKKDRYYYDWLAVQEEAVADHASGCGMVRAEQINRKDPDGSQRGNPNQWEPTETRNMRSIWTIPTHGFPGAHFATFPPEIPRRAIAAGSSEKGCCPECGTNWKRQVEKIKVKLDNGNRKRADAPGAEVSPTSVFRTGEYYKYETTGWEAGCKCKAGDPIPCTILDCFNGSGTTGLVAARLMRNYYGIDLSHKYIEMSANRLREDMPLFNNVVVRDVKDMVPASV